MTKEQVLLRLARQLNKENLVNDPELYLGPNWKTLLNFYTIMWNGKLKYINPTETVSNVQYRIHSSGSTYIRLLEKETLKIVSTQVKKKLPYYLVAWEIISMHRLLELGQTLKFCVLFGTVDTIKSDTKEER